MGGGAVDGDDAGGFEVDPQHLVFVVGADPDQPGDSGDGRGDVPVRQGTGGDLPHVGESFGEGPAPGGPVTDTGYHYPGELG